MQWIGVLPTFLPLTRCWGGAPPAHFLQWIGVPPTHPGLGWGSSRLFFAMDRRSSHSPGVGVGFLPPIFCDGSARSPLQVLLAASALEVPPACLRGAQSSLPRARGKRCHDGAVAALRGRRLPPPPRLHGISSPSRLDNSEHGAVPWVSAKRLSYKGPWRQPEAGKRRSALCRIKISAFATGRASHQLSQFPGIAYSIPFAQFRCHGVRSVNTFLTREA